MPEEKLPKLRAEDLFRLFVNRCDLTAFQKPDGRYAGNVKTNEKEWIKYLEAHLEGDLTLGSYALDTKNRSKWLCLDIDCKEEPQKAKILAQQLSFYLSEDLNIPHCVEFSGNKGYHVWIFADKPAQSAHLRRFARWFLGNFAGLKRSTYSEYIEWINDKKVTIEIYPKQDQTNGIGSLVKLPLGKHRLSGKRSFFVSFSDQLADMNYLLDLSTSISTKKKKPPVKINAQIILPQTPGEWNIYRALKELCSQGEQVKIPLKKLAIHTGYCRQTAAKWMHSLAEKGVINTELVATDTFQVYRPKYQKTTRLIKKEFFISINELPDSKNISQSNLNFNLYKPSFKIHAPYRKDLHASLVYLPMIGIWKDYATGRIFSVKDPVLKNFTP